MKVPDRTRSDASRRRRGGKGRAGACGGWGAGAARAFGLVAALVAVICIGAVPASAASAAQAAAYRAVLSDPDNLQTNVTLLEVQLAEGDLPGASVTLQRLLLLAPLFDKARLVRVAVSIQLGDNATAASDLAYLESRPLSAQDRAEAERLAGLVRTSSTDPRLSGLVRFGTLYESNPELAPGSVTLPNATVVTFDEESRFGAFGELQLLGEVPFGGAAGHSWRSQLHALGRVHAGGAREHSFARLATGPRIDLGFAFLDLQATGGLHLSGDDLYGTRLGGRAVLTVDVSNRVSAALRVDVAHETLDVDLYRADIIGDADGLEWSVRPSATFRLSSAWSLDGHVLLVMKNADSAWYSYDGWGGGAGVSYRSMAGYGARLSAAVQQIDYDAVDPNLAAGSPAREETRYQVSASVAAPLTQLVSVLSVGGWTAQWARDWSVESFATYSLVDSNVGSYDSSNVTVGVSVARRFAM